MHRPFPIRVRPSTLIGALSSLYCSPGRINCSVMSSKAYIFLQSVQEQTTNNHCWVCRTMYLDETVLEGLSNTSVGQFVFLDVSTFASP